jgi:hypothetical protein
VQSERRSANLLTCGTGTIADLWVKRARSGRDSVARCCEPSLCGLQRRAVCDRLFYHPVEVRRAEQRPPVTCHLIAEYNDLPWYCGSCISCACSTLSRRGILRGCGCIRWPEVRADGTAGHHHGEHEGGYRDLRATHAPNQRTAAGSFRPRDLTVSGRAARAAGRLRYRTAQAKPHSGSF